jgi:hypothetical protein
LIAEEISRYNVANGVIGLNRDILIHLTKDFKNDSDIAEVLFIFFYYYVIIVVDLRCSA